jgi:hypothetical protein
VRSLSSSCQEAYASAAVLRNLSKTQPLRRSQYDRAYTGLMNATSARPTPHRLGRSPRSRCWRWSPSSPRCGARVRVRLRPTRDHVEARIRPPFRLNHGTATHLISWDALTPLAMPVPWPMYRYRKPMVIGLRIPPNSLQAFPVSGANGRQPSATFTVDTCNQLAAPRSHSALGLQVDVLLLPSDRLQKSLCQLARDCRSYP